LTTASVVERTKARTTAPDRESLYFLGDGNTAIHPPSVSQRSGRPA
jgi:hypothetical protein